MSNTTPELRMSGVAEVSVASMLAWTRHEFARYNGNDLTTEIVSSPGNLRQAEITVKRDKADVKLDYPFALFMLTDVSLPTDMPALVHSSGNRGVMTNRDRANGFAEFENMRPVDLGFAVNFRTGNFQHVWQWMHTVMLAAPAVSLWIGSDEGFKVECKINFEPTMTIPPLDSNEGTGYSFDTVFRLRTRLGVVTTQRLIQELQLDIFDGRGGVDAAPFFQGTTAELLESVHWDYRDLFDPTHAANKYGATHDNNPER